MTIPLTGAGSLGVRLGHLGGCFLDLLSLAGGSASANVLAAASILTRYAQFETDYANGTALNRLLDGFYSQVTGFQGSLQSSLPGQFQQIAQQTLIEMANTDSPLAAKTALAALQYLVTQMTGVSSVQSSTVAIGAQTAQGSPVGNPAIVLTSLRPDGLISQLVYPETLTFACTQDSQGGATPQKEPLSCKGAAAVASLLAYNWPGGSGASATLNAVDAAQNNDGSNLLQNSEFATATTANVPDNWTLGPGVAGTTVFQANSGFADGFSLQFTGDVGGTLSQAAQAFGTAPTATVGAGGTLATLAPLNLYIFNCWIKCSATPAAGVLTFDLYDSTGAAVINNAQAVANSFTKSLTAVSTSWVNVSGVFCTPASLIGMTPRVRVRLSTAIDNGKSVYIDRVALAKVPTPLYAGGPYGAAFSGSVKLIKNDSWTFPATNTYGKFQQLFQRWFNTPTLVGANGLPLQLPYSGSPTVADSLIA